MTVTRNPWRPAVLAGAALAFTALGAIATYFYLGRPAAQPTTPAAAELPAGTAAAPANDRPASDFVVTLTPEVLTQSNVETAEVRHGESADDLRIPAVVEPDGYRQVKVTAVAAGQVVTVPVEAGQVVRRGDLLARVHTPAVAEAERALQATLAELSVWESQVARLERLVAIGAASRQEQEAAIAQRRRLSAEVESLRARLILLGRRPADISTTIRDEAPDPVVSILAPVAGTITGRFANPGQNVADGAELFALVNLDTVWIVGDVYERDLARIRVGTAARVIAASLPGVTFRGRVSYIDPQVVEETRTARVRVEVANPGARLRLGMFVDARLDLPASGALLVPRAAIQTIDRTDVVYVVDPGQAGRFVERSVRLGDSAGDDVVVLAGLAPGDRVVTRGSFLLRSERERRHPGPPAPAPAVAAPPPASPAQRSPGAPDVKPETVQVTVTKAAFEPSELAMRAGRPLRIVFTRRDEDTCATEVVVPSLGIRKALPLGKPVTIDLPPQAAGSVAFMCGMDMLRGAIVVK
jgi:RND family efflux transporter MFP subunit